MNLSQQQEERLQERLQELEETNNVLTNKVKVFETINLPKEDLSELNKSLKSLEKVLSDPDQTEGFKLDYFKAIVDTYSQPKYRTKSSSMRVIFVFLINLCY